MHGDGNRLRDARADRGKHAGTAESRRIALLLQVEAVHVHAAEGIDGEHELEINLCLSRASRARAGHQNCECTGRNGSARRNRAIRMRVRALAHVVRPRGKYRKISPNSGPRECTLRSRSSNKDLSNRAKRLQPEFERSSCSPDWSLPVLPGTGNPRGRDGQLHSTIRAAYTAPRSDPDEARSENDRTAERGGGVTLPQTLQHPQAPAGAIRSPRPTPRRSGRTPKRSSGPARRACRNRWRATTLQTATRSSLHGRGCCRCR